jgi:short-subunit dehydrogenase
MTGRLEKYGEWALVAGAAEGLGKAFAMALAEHRKSLILVDMNHDPLEELGQHLETSFRVRTRKILLDLASEDSAVLLMEAIERASCRLVVYNAAYSRVKKFLDNTQEELDRYVRINVQIPLELAHAFSRFHSGHPEMKKGLILMASLAGSWGTRLLAPYGATKAFSQILAESLYHELKGEGFDVIACIAGATSTPGYLSSNPVRGRISPPIMSPIRVAEETLRSLGRRVVIVPGFWNKLTYFILSRILSRRFSLWIMNRAVSRAYRDRL